VSVKIMWGIPTTQPSHSIFSWGKAYTAGGRNGIYFRENLSSSQKRQNKNNIHSSVNNSSSMNTNSFKVFGIVCCIACILISFAFPIIFIISIPWTLIIILSIVNNSKIQKFKKETISTLNNFLVNKELMFL